MFDYTVMLPVPPPSHTFRRTDTEPVGGAELTDQWVFLLHTFSFKLEPLEQASCATSVTMVTYHSKKPKRLTHTPLLFHSSEMALLMTVT